jgi:CheY-like chemotaxis protein
VYVESEYGKGTTFTITFPLIHGDEKQVKIEGELQQFIMVRPGASVRILVADDLQVNVTVVQGFLEKHGMRADTVRNGAEAIQKLQAMEERGQGYDLVFMDSLMPVMDGIEATKRIRALGGRFKTLPIVALSADATIDSVESYLKAGMNDFQPKPMSGSELNVMLGRWLPPEKVQTVQESQAWSRKERFSHPAGTPGSHAPVTPPPAHTPAPEPAPAFEYAAPRERAWGDPVMDALAGIPGLDVEQGMNFTGGKPEFYESALREFCDTFDDLFSGVSQDVAQRDWKEYSVKVHGLKGILAMLGATTLSEWARKLELAGKQAASEAATESARVEKEDSEKLCVEKTPVVMQRFAVFRNYVDRALNQKGAAA